LNIIEEDVVRFTNLSNGTVFKHAGNVYIKMQNVDTERSGNINCVNLKNGDYGHTETDTVVQKFETAELHLR
jgi:hypothetical protein